MTHDYIESYTDNSQPMKVFYASNTVESYTLTDNGSNPFVSSLPGTCNLSFELLYWNDSSSEWRSSQDDGIDHISITHTSDALISLDFANPSPGTSGNKAYFDTNGELLFKISVTFQEDLS